MTKKDTLLDTPEDRAAAYDNAGTLEEIQIIHEMAGIDEGIKKYRDSLLDPKLKLSETAAGRKIFADMMRTLVPAIEDAQEEAIEGIANSGKGSRAVWWWHISFISAEKLAMMTVKTILGVRTGDFSYGRSGTAVTLEIGVAVRQQIEFQRWQVRSKQTSEETGGPDLAAKLISRAKNFNQRQWGNWTRKIDQIETLDWTRDQRGHIGAKLLQLAIEHTNGFFILRYVQMRGKTQRQVFLSNECQAMIEDIHSSVEVITPAIKPMLIASKPWKWCEHLGRYKGGYCMVKVDFIRGGLHKHTANLTDPVSQTTLDAANSLGGVPYRVDEPILDVSMEIYNQGLGIIEYLPKPDPVALPDRLEDSKWDQMSRKERAQWKYNLTKLHEKNASDVSKRESAIRKFHLSNDHRGLELFHPIKMDTRGRFYYTTPDWNPQGDGLARGTMRFANGVALGSRGLYWLAVRLCNTYGNDKVTFDEMQVWASEHHDLIEDSATQPFDGFQFWASADSPLEFLQTCMEWTAATGCDNPETFLSTLPVHQDGSNNGLQLMSLLGRDPVGAKLTNCSSEDARFDIYSETADVVNGLIAEDIRMGKRTEEAHRWVGNVGRAECKRACMTTSYGVTPRGIQDQLISDGFCDKLDGDLLKNAGYLRDKLVIALEQTVVASRPIMDYFQQVATALADKGVPMQWRTPAGTTIQQSYWNVSKTDIKTVMGSYFLWDENPLGGLNIRKQALGASPNVIHSLDAALMHRMIVDLKSQGVTDVCAIHDSFAVHPSNVDMMRNSIRSTAADIFKGDWIADEFHPHVRRISKGADLPEPPVQGTFDPQEVLSAPYFFA